MLLAGLCDASCTAALDSSFQNKSLPETGETVLLGDFHFQYGWNSESGRYIVEDYINVFFLAMNLVVLTFGIFF